MMLRSFLGMICPVREWCVLRLDIGNDPPPPPAPDPRIGEAAAGNIEIQREYLNLAREEYAFRKERDLKMAPLFESMVTQYIESSEKNAARSDEAWQRYKTTGIPTEDEYLAAAREVGTEADQARAAGRAVADVDTQFDVADEMARREMSRAGVTPSDGANIVGRRLALLGRAGARAGAATRATESQRLLGLAAKEGAAKFVRGLPSQGLAADAAAINAGSAATGTIGQQTNLHQAGVTGQANLLSGAAGAGSSAGNLLLGQFNAQQNAYQSALQADAAGMQALGSLAGAAIGIGAGTKWRYGFKHGGKVRAPRMLRYAGGGKIMGPGGPKDDAIPAMIDGKHPAALSDGEFVVKADSTAKYGEHAMEDVNAGTAEVIPEETLVEIGRQVVKHHVLALTKRPPRAPITLENGG